MLRVPLDWNDPTGATIAIRVEWIPARDPHATQTVVAQDGGPGSPSTGSGIAYVGIFGPLLRNRNLLLMDERGTGGSTPIDCPPLQRAVARGVVGAVFQRVAAACGAQLDHTFRTPDGSGYVHAADLFSTTQSIRDLSFALRTLGIDRIDLFGESYGTFFAQAFAAAYPQTIRSLVLDSAYPLDRNVFDPPARDEIRFAFDAVCRRSTACAAAAPGSSVARIRRLAKRLAATPITTEEGTYDEKSLATLLQSASLDTPMLEYRNLDAAARAWLDRGDPVPLGRLFDRSTVAGALSSLFSAYSVGMEVADECTVYRSPFHMRAPLDERRRQYHAAIAALPRGMFDPVSPSASLSAGPLPIDECLSWPAPAHDEPLTVTAPLVPPTLPVLILSGDLDSITAPGDAEQARRELGPSAIVVTLPNSGHSSTFYDANDCAQRIVRAFIERPGTRPDTACTVRIPEVRAVGIFPQTLIDEPPASPRIGDRATRREAQVAALAIAAVGDAIESARYAAYNEALCDRRAYCGDGLRGGSFVSTPDATKVGLYHYAYSRDTQVTGVAKISGARVWYGAGRVTVRLVVHADGDRIVEALRAAWDERVPHARATIDGLAQDGRPIHESTPAP